MSRIFAKANERGSAQGRTAAAPVPRPAPAARVGRLVSGPRVQAKLRVGAPDDAYEREADRVADRVMRMPEPEVQRQPVEDEEEELLQTKPLLQRVCAGCEEERLQRQSEEEEEEEMLQTKPLLQRVCTGCEEEQLQRQPEEEEEEMLQTKPLVQRMCAECEEEAVQAEAAPGAVPEVVPSAAAEIRSLSGGRPLPAAERAFFESRMGADFADVRLHTGQRAEALASGVQARAFTHGRDVVFGRGEYAAGSAGGRRLLAHELTHVLQQRRRPSAVQRLKVTQHKLTKGTCRERNVQWVFELDKKAPADGYIVQQIDKNELIDKCPTATVGPPGPIPPFWEAWFVKQRDKVDWTTVRDKWTDGNTRSALPGTNGSDIAVGEIKFFKKSTTGDLGDYGKAPSDPKMKALWGPGKVRSSGALPSTPTKPSWWSNTPVEGPAKRGVWASWDCCGSDKSKHSFNLKVQP